jgi:hypothetical protein
MRLVAERLDAIVPERVRVEYQDGRFQFRLGSVLREELTFPKSSPNDEGWPASLANAIWTLLDSLQDFVIEEVGIQPWPVDTAGGLPRAHAEVSNGKLVFSYGHPERPALAFEPIPLPERER